MEPFPRIDSRRGPRSAPSSVCAEATFDGIIAFTSWGGDEFSRILPRDLTQTAPRIVDSCASHPVAIVLGTQSSTAVYFGGVRMPTNLRFHELMIAVPFVRRRDDSTLYSFVARMYATDVRSTWPGNAFYGFEKQLSRIDRSGTTFTVGDEGGTPTLSAAARPDGEWASSAPLAGQITNPLITLSTMPALGRRRDGSYATTTFDWSLADAASRPAALVVSIDDRFTDGHIAAELEGVPGSTFEVRGMRWGIGWPTRLRT